ncbi:lys-63-specific deubiquitinase BRCC36-like [Cryptotermes secundus]|uniref:lys-63-specific deubiquitinase BRCC36-like n=1 Tax=Cryptotermes secundus TaxID=105785 RepID=UPI000CD7CAA7|nr:lys-63-specific deubiquitinase BRCC36-like [Cryptotermes secundus]
MQELQVQLTCFQSTNQSPEGEAPQFIRLEVPLHIKPTESISKLCLQSMVELPEILFQEERDSYDLTTKLKFLSVLAQLNNKAVLTKALCHITEVVSGPLVTSLEQRKATNVKRCDELIKEKQMLIALQSRS